MRKVLILLMLCIGFGASAQEVYTSSGKPANAKKKEEKKKGFDPSRLIVGGGIGFGIGDVTTFSVSPIVGYRISEKFAAGVGFGYQYLKVKDYFELQELDSPYAYQYYDYKSSIISVSVWGRYLIFRNLFVQLAYEHNFMSFQNYRYGPGPEYDIEPFKIKYNAPSVLVGVGFRQPISDNASMFIMAQYDVLQNEYSPYYGRIVPNIGFNIGF
jgi:hypothetical protein